MLLPRANYKKIAGEKKEKPERSETSFFGTSSPRPSFWQSMRKSVFSILRTSVGPYSKPLLSIVLDAGKVRQLPKKKQIQNYNNEKRQIIKKKKKQLNKR